MRCPCQVVYAYVGRLDSKFVLAEEMLHKRVINPCDWIFTTLVNKIFAEAVINSTTIVDRNGVYKTKQVSFLRHRYIPCNQRTRRLSWCYLSQLRRISC